MKAGIAGRRHLTAGVLGMATLWLASADSIAAPADCEVMVEGTVIYGGPCDFNTTDADGSFEFTADGISATVLLDPGAATGVAFYENSTGRGKDGNWKLGDVNRDGACWANQYGHICAWAAGTRPGGATATPPSVSASASGRLHEFGYDVIGQWHVNRYASDENGADTVYCSAMKLTGSEQGIYYRFDGQTFGSGFSGYSSAYGDGPMDVALWFDDEPRPMGYQTPMVLEADRNGFEWRMSFESNDEPTSADLHMNANVLHYAYQVDGQDHVETFPLAGSNAALKALFNCYY